MSNLLRVSVTIEGVIKKRSKFTNIEEYSQFLSLAYHQIKNPLTSMYGFLELLDKQIEENDKAKNYSLKVKKQAESVIRIVKNLSVVNKLLKKKEKNNLEILQFDKTVLEIIDAMRQKITHKIQVTGITGKHVIMDREQLEFVIQNLISNAVKFSEETSEIKVNFSGKKKEVVLCVEDFGKGVPKGKEDDVFIPFSQLFLNRKEKYCGSGIGLFVTREIIIANKGTIKCKTKEKGLELCFTLSAVETR